MSSGSHLSGMWAGRFCQVDRLPGHYHCSSVSASTMMTVVHPGGRRLHYTLCRAHQAKFPLGTQVAGWEGFTVAGTVPVPSQVTFPLERHARQHALEALVAGEVLDGYFAALSQASSA